MINSNVFDYVNVLDKAADASWLRHEAISNNLSNVDTPGYKRQDVDFEGTLRRALKNSRYPSMDSKVDDVKLSRLKPRTYTDYAAYSYRLDGNNVDPDTENVMMASNQLKYNALMESVKGEFANLRYVIK